MRNSDDSGEIKLAESFHPWWTQPYETTYRQVQHFTQTLASNNCYCRNEKDIQCGLILCAFLMGKQI